ncbi:FAD-binding oxidoreductase [Shinella sp. CPCC 101442]|uniref:NAD(P)/FAD-dependent oxidoreductase n=1 Tax=Shinella sp. CPCC 101442 TaxID=2932265 RepID=UPI002152827D|nr:FAD-binding oxidoreductase [Shinella sp. CPCC 101442]MCR6500346.1 FAD-binding oxidoreductase [Shinella sp. CPCC 101442]
MPNADSPVKASGQSPVDLLVAGGGVMGLWTALFAAQKGLSIRLVDRRYIGSGASGGVLGALMPHLPDRWNAKKAFQFAALVSLEGEIAALEAETGLSTGYRRSGRFIPLAKPQNRDNAIGQVRDARAVWTTPDRAFAFELLDTAPIAGWPARDAMPYGLVHDHLAARLSPRGLVAALKAALRHRANVEITEGTGLAALDPAAGLGRLDDGTVLSFGHCVLAAGVETFPLLQLLTPLAKPAGMGVKGQAALLKASVDPAQPVIFADGLYIVPHENGLVAIGSTSENSFEDAESTDHMLEALVENARHMAPVLANAPVVQRWAGLRPKAIGREPMVGRHPDHANLSLMTGGFKVSFGLAHALARTVLDEIEGGTLDVPPSFTVTAHIEQAGRI